jgi:hypothetical protein
VETFGASGLIGMSGQRNMADNYLNKTVTLTSRKTNGLEWDSCIWHPTKHMTIEHIRTGKITGKIIHYRKIGVRESIKVRIDPEYANLFSYADLSFNLKDVIINQPIDDILEDVNFDI